MYWYVIIQRSHYVPMALVIITPAQNETQLWWVKTYLEISQCNVNRINDNINKYTLGLP